MIAKTLFALFLLTAPALHSKTLIEAAYDAGEIDLETALIYQLQSLRDPDQLPNQYRQTHTRPLCGTPQLLQASQAASHLGPDYWSLRGLNPQAAAAWSRILEELACGDEVQVQRSR